MTIKVLAYLIIPVYTIAFTGGYNWFTTNFSVIGNLMDKKLAFLIWGIVVGLYFYLIYRRLRPLVRLRSPSSSPPPWPCCSAPSQRPTCRMRCPSNPSCTSYSPLCPPYCC